MRALVDGWELMGNRQQIISNHSGGMGAFLLLRRLLYIRPERLIHYEKRSKEG